MVTPYSVGWFCWTIPGLWILFNIVWNYLHCIFTPPGSPQPVDDAAVDPDEPAPRRGEGFSKYCKTCKVPKPARTHHCHICKRCVLAMDHHCPWVHNCVGHMNYRYFYLFLFYMTVGCVYGASLTFRSFRQVTTYKSRWSGEAPSGEVPSEHLMLDMRRSVVRPKACVW